MSFHDDTTLVLMTLAIAAVVPDWKRDRAGHATRTEDAPLRAIVAYFARRSPSGVGRIPRARSAGISARCRDTGRSPRHEQARIDSSLSRLLHRRPYRDGMVVAKSTTGTTEVGRCSF